MFLSVDGVRSRISNTASQGVHRRRFLALIHGGHSRISGTASQGARHRRFSALMVDAPESLAPPLREPVIDVS
jgi:hypothetical protein